MTKYSLFKYSTVSQIVDVIRKFVSDSWLVNDSQVVTALGNLSEVNTSRKESFCCIAARFMNH